jgi:phenylpropionate dioxygenase-like ring-hydroxylating dioxygenase large terminal subunit
MISALDPRPAGWFAIARSGELSHGKVGVLATLPYRSWREPDGKARVQVAGKVVPVAEQNGFVFAWHHPAGAAPTWTIPALDETGWRPLRHHFLRTRSHPQEVYENSIDTGHFPVIHGYSDIAVETPMKLDGHEMHVGYAIARRIPVPFVKAKSHAHFTVHLHGIGCAHNHIHVPMIDLKVRMFALATPTEAGQVEIRLAVSVAKDCKLPRALLPLVHTGVKASIVGDFEQDIAVWERKVFVRPPFLVKGDGPIEAFRRWAAQFYAVEAAA